MILILHSISDLHLFFSNSKYLLLSLTSSTHYLITIFLYSFYTQYLYSLYYHCLAFIHTQHNHSIFTLHSLSSLLTLLLSTSAFSSTISLEHNHSTFTLHSFLVFLLHLCNLFHYFTGTKQFYLHPPLNSGIFFNTKYSYSLPFFTDNNIILCIFSFYSQHLHSLPLFIDFHTPSPPQQQKFFLHTPLLSLPKSHPTPRYAKLFHGLSSPFTTYFPLHSQQNNSCEPSISLWSPFP